jgi:hypothetical protein
MNEDDTTTTDSNASTDTSSSSGTDSSQSSGEKKISFNTNDFPTIYMYSQFSSEDDLLRNIGIDPAIFTADPSDNVA